MQNAAERLIKAAQGLEPNYNEAYRVALQQLDAGAETAEIQAETPRYLPGLLLYAYAIENLFKGLMAANNPEKLSESDSNFFKGHISKVAEKSGVTVSEEQGKLIKRLEDIVMWMGRYPLPLTRKNQDFLGVAPESIIDAYRDVDVARETFDELKKQLITVTGRDPKQFDLLVQLSDGDYVEVYSS